VDPFAEWQAFSHRSFRFAFSIALSPAGIIRPVAMGSSAFSLLIFDQRLRAPRGVNFCSHANPEILPHGSRGPTHDPTRLSGVARCAFTHRDNGTVYDVGRHRAMARQRASILPSIGPPASVAQIDRLRNVVTPDKPWCRRPRCERFQHP
jgi:hypothetical protein